MDENSSVGRRRSPAIKIDAGSRKASSSGMRRRRAKRRKGKREAAEEERCKGGFVEGWW